MSIWDLARQRLATSVVTHLGEDLTLNEADPGMGTAQVRGVLVRPESRVRLGNVDYSVADAILTLRSADLPAWFGRGTQVTAPASGEQYRVTQSLDNGEGVTEAMLCRL